MHRGSHCKPSRAVVWRALALIIYITSNIYQFTIYQFISISKSKSATAKRTYELNTAGGLSMQFNLLF